MSTLEKASALPPNSYLGFPTQPIPSIPNSTTWDLGPAPIPDPTIWDLGPAPNPYIWDLPVSAVVALPALICLLLFSVYIIYLILRRSRALLPLYLSVLFYLVSQLLLLAALSGSWLMKIEGRLECRVTLALETFSYMLPGYCILIITLVRVLP